tara:strand:+ start:55 stop:291 length:237 start_codon:yes stop_codon:yes gene_type:complete
MKKKTNTEKAAIIINDAMEAFAEKRLDPDMISFLLMCTALSMALRNNPHSPCAVTQMVASAMEAAVTSVMDDEKETKH